jgi:mono/diheme cytochrome c family protein
MRAGMPPSVVSNDWTYPDDDTIRSFITQGIPERGMPAAQGLSDPDIRRLIAYLRAQAKTP